MKKEHIVKAMIEIIEKKAKELNLVIENKGTGHGFDDSFWKGLIKDKSNIPNIIAKSDCYKIELRSFWGNPELDIHKYGDNYSELLVLNYSDFKWIDRTNKKHEYTEDYYVKEVRCEGNGNYKELINEIYEIIDEIERKVNGYENE